jgi:hypothetical protein
MSLRTLWLSSSLALVATLALGCGSSPPPTDEPTTAKEKQRRDTEAKGDTGTGAGKWGGWRYTGDRNDCFFVVGRRCFKTEAAACSAARCGKRRCETTGGGPAAVSCVK